MESEDKIKRSIRKLNIEAFNEQPKSLAKSQSPTIEHTPQLTTSKKSKMNIPKNIKFEKKLSQESMESLSSNISDDDSDNDDKTGTQLPNVYRAPLRARAKISTDRNFDSSRIGLIGNNREESEL